MIGLHLGRHSPRGASAAGRPQEQTLRGHQTVAESREKRTKRGHSHRDHRGGQAVEAGRRRRMGSVQLQYVAAEAVIGDVLVLAAQTSVTGHARRIWRAGRGTPAHAHDYRAILEVSSVNYALKTEGEQEAVLAGYHAFLNGLTYPVQILVEVRPLDLAPYLSRLRAGLRTARDHVGGSGAGAGQGSHAGKVTAMGEDRDGDTSRAAVWDRLAEDEERYVLDLAARRTLLERHFYVVLPADEGAGSWGSGAGGVTRTESSLSEGAGLTLPSGPSSFPSWLPLLGRRRRRQSAATRELLRAAKQLALRAHAVARELERLGLEARRLADEELVAVYHRAIAPDAAARFPLPNVVLAGVGMPVTTSETAAAMGDDEWSVGDARRDAGPGASAPPLESAESDDGVGDGAGAGAGPSGMFGDLADVLAPASVSLTRDDVRLDDTLCRTLAVVGYPRHVYAGWLERLIDLDEPLDVVLHVRPQSTAAMIRQLSHRLVQLHSSRLLNEERGRVGHPELGVAYRDVEQMRERLQRGDERIFATSLYLHVRAPALPGSGPGTERVEGTRRALDDRVARIETELANQQLVARPATFEQDLALLSCLPEGRDRLLRTRLLDTSSLATAFPFVSNSLSMPGGILFGTTANGSPVFIDAFAPELENANKVVFAKSGAGKSYACKVEALRSLLRGTDVYVVDPEAEYEPLATAVGGQTVRLAAGAHQHLNPFDLPAATEREVAREVGAGGDVLADKVQSLHALLDLMLADRGPTGTAGLSQREKGLLDRALYEVYRRAGITSDPATHARPAPLLRDLYDVLVGGSCGADDAHLAERLHRYVHGSLSRLFDTPTNVQLSNRLVVFDVRDLDAELRPLGLFLIAEFVWTRIRRERRPRLLVIDEAWTLMQYQEGGRFLAGLARRARKYYLGLVTITQDAQDFLSSEHGRTVLANSSVQLLMKQDSSTIDAVSKAFRLSSGERQYLLGCHKGEGLLFARGGHVALQIGASPFEHELATTDPRELAAREHAARAAPSTPAPRAIPAEQAPRAGGTAKGQPPASDAERTAPSGVRRGSGSGSTVPRGRRDRRVGPVALAREEVVGAQESAMLRATAARGALTDGDERRITPGPLADDVSGDGGDGEARGEDRGRDIEAADALTAACADDAVDAVDAVETMPEGGVR